MIKKAKGRNLLLRNLRTSSNIIMAALNVADFHKAQPSGLSLFSLPPYQSVVERMYFQEVRSNSQLTGKIIDIEITGKHCMEYNQFVSTINDFTSGSYNARQDSFIYN